MVQVNRYDTVEDRNLDVEKRKLRKEVDTRIKTAFIFAIAEFERIFKEDIDDDETFREDFQKFRKNVLDNGNDQIRLLDVVFNRIQKLEQGPQFIMRKE